jgi:hypothetical protein
MRDLAEHEKRPSAFLVYLHVWRRSVGVGQKVASLSHQQMAEGTGLSKSAVQGAVRLLKKRKLLSASLKIRLLRRRIELNDPGSEGSKADNFLDLWVRSAL